MKTNGFNLKQADNKKRIDKEKLIIAIFALCTIAAIIFLNVFSDYVPGNKKKNCIICKVSDSSVGDYCLDCVRNYQCFVCDEVKEDSVEGICAECMAERE